MKFFNTFFIGGYECADMINNRRKRVNLLTLTGHDQHAEEDYTLLAAAGICTVREGICWSAVEKEPYRYDFTEVKARIAAAQRHGIQQLWDICHFGYPDGLTPLHPDFTSRFVSICKAFTELYRACTDEPLIVTPVNEISFMSHLSGRVAGTVPFLRRSGRAIKYNLCKAAIKGIEAIKIMDATAKTMMVEPLIRIHAKEGRRPSEVHRYNEQQFEAMDIITGRRFPELGGRPDYMDLAGFNYYYNNQWEHKGRHLCWKGDKEKCDFPGWLKLAADRYGKPVVLSETGHFKEDRALWIRQITDDCIEAMNRGVNLKGICIYPVLDRPDWDHLSYIPCGVWGYDEQTKKRFVDRESLEALKASIEKVDDFLTSRNRIVEQPSDMMAA